VKGKRTHETRAARRLKCDTLRYAGTYVSRPDTSRGRGNSYGPTSSVSGERSRWSFRSLACTREATTRKISGDMGFCSTGFSCYSKMIETTHLVVCDVIIGAHALDLHRTEHPANVVDYFYIGRSGLEDHPIL
jgi:hypothetical protein